MGISTDNLYDKLNEFDHIVSAWIYTLVQCVRIQDSDFFKKIYEVLEKIITIKKMHYAGTNVYNEQISKKEALHTLSYHSEELSAELTTHYENSIDMDLHYLEKYPNLYENYLALVYLYDKVHGANHASYCILVKNYDSYIKRVKYPELITPHLEKLSLDFDRPTIFSEKSVTLLMINMLKAHDLSQIPLLATYYSRLVDAYKTYIDKNNVMYNELASLELENVKLVI